MKRWKLVMNGAVDYVKAEFFRQDGCYVAFYVNKEVTSLARLGEGDYVTLEQVV